MKGLKRLFTGLMLAISSIAVATVQSPVIPMPAKVEYKSGKGIEPAKISYVVAEGCDIPVLYGPLKNLPRKLLPGKIGVKLFLDSALSIENPEGYTLNIASGGAVVKSRGQEGLFYGAVTLARLLEDSFERGVALPQQFISDEPVHKVRAVHFDTKHHLDRSEYYYTLIDRLAQWKVNNIIWEIEDKLRYEKHPECSSPNALSKQEMRAISDYAKERNIEISPLVQGLGHAGYILKHHWELRENPESDWEFCPSNPATYDLLYDLYSEAMEAMPYGKYLHIGGDEITEIGIDDRCVATGKTAFALQMEWLGKVCDFANENGRTPIFWDDMPFKYGDLWWVIHRGLTDEEVDANWHTDKLDEAIDMFPRNCIYMRWHYDDPTIYPHLKALEWYKNKGLRVMGATAAADGGSPYMPRYGSKIGHIRSFCQLAVENNLSDGIFATCWDDGSPHWETVQRGFAALGEYGWNPYGRSIENFKEAFARGFHGLYNGETGFIETLEDAAAFFDGALVTEGRRNPSWQVKDHKLMDLPDKHKIGEWSNKYAGRIDSANIQVERCSNLVGYIDNAISTSRRNRYPLQIHKANNRLFAFPAKLILALAEYDKTGGSKESVEAIEKIIYEFDRTKQNLVETYGKTRFMSLPTGYIQDMNHHSHLAALKPDSSWLFLYEDQMVDKIKKELLED